jgi:putative colanic acid biosynthesis acetyltransferase WcaF
MTILDASYSKPLKGGPSFSLKHRFFRAMWNVAWFIFASWTPPFFHCWRVLLLNLFGSNIHFSAHVYGSTRIWYPPYLSMGAGSCLGPRVNCYCMAPIRLEDGAIVSQGTYLCAGTHDIEDEHFQLIVRPITIGNGAWIAAEAFIGPGVKVGNNAVIGARTVLLKDAMANSVYSGNPAQLIKLRKINLSTEK